MRRRSRLRRGDWHVTSDVTGCIVPRSQCKKQWNGLMVEKHQWEPRHPQDTLTIRAENIAIPDARPFSPNYTVSNPELQNTRAEDIVKNYLLSHGYNINNI